jgi:3-deoxy-manno-octulosonate cytidylyltransferase (CMP-KDO synthetase)
MEFHVVIPVNANMLSVVEGPPMVLTKQLKSSLQRAYKKAIDSGAESIVIATSVDEVAEFADTLDAEVCLTSGDNATCIEQLSEVVEAMEYEDSDVVVMFHPDVSSVATSLIREVVEDLLEHDHVRVSSVCSLISDEAQFNDPDTIKVVLNKRNQAVYFSRSALPYVNGSFEAAAKQNRLYAHLGLYAFRAKFLADYISWEESPLERLEAIEQLRMIWNGVRIHMRVSTKATSSRTPKKKEVHKA